MKHINPETIAEMQSEIKKKAGLHTNNNFKGENNFDKMPTVNNIPIALNELDGNNYLMVYGVGTPSENALELQTAYNQAKLMPRYIGTYNSGNVINIKKGQVFVNSGIPVDYFVALVDYNGTIGAAPSGTFTGMNDSIDPKSIKTTVIVAPGIYTFGLNKFTVNQIGIDIVSLTGNSDVKIDGIIVSNNNLLIKGIDCGSEQFVVGTITDENIYENCVGNENSFYYTDVLYGTYIGCRVSSNLFPSALASGAKVINCYNGDGTLVNYPISQSQTGVGIKMATFDNADKFFIGSSDINKTIICSNNLSSSSEIIWDNLNFTADERNNQNFIITLILNGYFTIKIGEGTYNSITQPLTDHQVILIKIAGEQFPLFKGFPISIIM